MTEHPVGRWFCMKLHSWMYHDIGRMILISSLQIIQKSRTPNKFADVDHWQSYCFCACPQKTWNMFSVLLKYDIQQFFFPHEIDSGNGELVFVQTNGFMILLFYRPWSRGYLFYFLIWLNWSPNDLNLTMYYLVRVLLMKYKCNIGCFDLKFWC